MEMQIKNWDGQNPDEVPKTPYYQNAEVRLKIDTLLHENAKLESNLGKDSTKSEYADTKVKQDRLFRQIKSLDLEFYKIITTENDRE